MAVEEYRIDVPITASDQTDATIQAVQKKLSGLEANAANLGKTKIGIQATLIDNATQVIGRITSTVQNLTRHPFRITLEVLDKASAPLRGVLGLMKNLIDSAFSLKGALVGGGLLGGGIFAPLMAADAYQQSTLSFTTLFKGDQMRAQQMMSQIQNFAQKTPFTTNNLKNYVQQLMAVGFNPDTQIFPYLTAIGDTAVSFKGSGAEGRDAMSTIVTAIREMKGKNQLSAQQMVRMLGGLGVNGYQILAEQYNKDQGTKYTEQQVRMLAEQNRLPINTSIRLLMQGLEQHYGGAMNLHQGESISGLWSDITDVTQQKLLIPYGQGLQSAVIPAMQNFVKTIDSWQKDGTLDALAKGLYDLGHAISDTTLGSLQKLADWGKQIFESPEWQAAPDLFSKIGVFARAASPEIEQLGQTILHGLGGALNNLVVKPFSEWFEGGGKESIQTQADTFGRGLGSAMKNGLLAILGVGGDGGGAASTGNDFVDAGVTAVTSFMKGFTDGFDAGKLMQAIITKFGEANKKAFTDLGSGKLDGGDMATGLVDIMLFNSFGGGGLLGGLAKGGIGKVLGTIFSRVATRAVGGVAADAAADAGIGAVAGEAAGGLGLGALASNPIGWIAAALGGWALWQNSMGPGQSPQAGLSPDQIVAQAKQYQTQTDGTTRSLAELSGTTDKTTTALQDFWNWITGITGSGPIGNSGINSNGGVGSAPYGPARPSPTNADDAVVEAYIRQSAAAHGIDPDTAVKVWRGEGSATPSGNWTGDAGSSFGPFQLHKGGIAGGGNAGPGLGNTFQTQTGLDPSDPSNWQAEVDWSLGQAAQGGWGPWHGGARVGITGFMGVAGHRAAGGPVSSRLPYLVGERGPEIFVPGSNGSIAPNGALAGLAGSWGSFQVDNITINFPTAPTGANTPTIASELLDELMRQMARRSRQSRKASVVRRS